jgi:reactive chlorine resistance protein C
MADTNVPTSSGLEAAIRLETWGIRVSRYGLVLVLVLIGGLKFTGAEAHGIEPLIRHSPVLSWLLGLLGVQAVSNLIGLIELTLAVLIALRPLKPAVSFAGSVGATVMFVITLSFLISTPGAISSVTWFPMLGEAGQFLIKDVGLLGVSLLTAADALQAWQFDAGHRPV